MEKRILKRNNSIQLVRSLKSQTFSIDFIIAFSIFLVSVFFFYSFLISNLYQNPKLIQEDAIFLARQTAESTAILYFVDGAIVDEQELSGVEGMDYFDLKRRAGATSDFEIYFETGTGILDPIEDDDILIEKIENPETDPDNNKCIDGDMLKANKFVLRKGRLRRLIITSCG